MFEFNSLHNNLQSVRVTILYILNYLIEVTNIPINFNLNLNNNFTQLFIE